MRGRFFVTVSALLPIGADTRQKNRLLSRPSRAIVRKIGSTAAGHDPPDAVSPDAFSSRIISEAVLLHHLGARLRDDTRDPVGATGIDHTGGLAARVAPDPRLGHLLEADHLDRAAIEVSLRARELQQHRMVGDDRVEFRARERALVVGELIGRPAAQRVHPLSGSERLRLRPDHLDGLLSRLDAVEPQLHAPEDALLHVVRVVVDESRGDGAAAKIDAAGVRPGQLRDLLIRADRGDTFGANGYCLRDAEAIVNRDDLAVEQDRVWRRACCAGALREGGLLCREHRSNSTCQDRRDDNALPYPP